MTGETTASRPHGRPPSEAQVSAPSLRSLLRDSRDYRLLWLGTLATQGGQWALQVAIGWLMLDLTGSEFWVGLSGFAGGIPMLAASVPAGILVDRVDRRRVLSICQAALCALGGTMAVIVVLDLASPWELLIAAFLNGAFMTVNNTARQTVVPDSVPRDQLGAAVAYASAGQNGTRVIGPSLAGAAIAAAGVAGAFAFQAVLLAAALGLTLRLSLPRLDPLSASSTPIRALDGARYLVRSPVLRDLTILASIPTLAVFPYIQLLPVYARDILDIGPQGLGLLLASSGIGAVGGAMLAAGYTRRRFQGASMLALTVLYGVVVIAFSQSTWVVLSILLLVLAGLTGSAYLSLNNALFQLHVEDDVRGRVLGAYMLTWGLMPLGALPMGAVARWYGAPTAISAGAILSIGLALILALRSPALRTL